MSDSEPGPPTALNPALAEARFCPRCGREAQVDYPHRLDCPYCGFREYFNPSPVAAAIPFDAEGRVILLRRGFAPSAGRWVFPGGFVELGESVPDAVRREVDEELGMAIELQDLVGVYSRADDRVVLIVYRARALSEPGNKPEPPAVRAVAWLPGLDAAQARFPRRDPVGGARILVHDPGAAGGGRAARLVSVAVLRPLASRGADVVAP